jgi:hypothetical protein
MTATEDFRAKWHRAVPDTVWGSVYRFLFMPNVLLE